MKEFEKFSQPMQNMGNSVDRALDDKGKKPSQFEVTPDISHKHDAEVLVDKPSVPAEKPQPNTPKKVPFD